MEGLDIRACGVFRVASLSWQQKVIRFRTHSNEDIDRCDKPSLSWYNVQPREDTAPDLEEMGTQIPLETRH